MTETRDSTATPERGRPRKEDRLSPPARLALFYRQIIAELRKVIWPNRKQMVSYTSVVLVFLVFMVTLIGVIDLGLARLVMLVFG